MKHLVCITLGNNATITKQMFEFIKNDIKEQLKDYPDLIPLIVLKEVSKIQVESLMEN